MLAGLSRHSNASAFLHLSNNSECSEKMNTQAKAQNTKHAPNPRPVSNRVRIADREPPTLADAAQDALAVFQQYAKDRPDVVAFTCLGVGFVLGWKLKPW